MRPALLVALAMCQSRLHWKASSSSSKPSNLEWTRVCHFSAKASFCASESDLLPRLSCNGATVSAARACATWRSLELVSMQLNSVAQNATTQGKMSGHGLLISWTSPNVAPWAFNATAQILSVNTGKVYPDVAVCWSSESTRFAAKEHCISLSRSASPSFVSESKRLWQRKFIRSWQIKSQCQSLCNLFILCSGYVSVIVSLKNRSAEHWPCLFSAVVLQDFLQVVFAQVIQAFLDAAAFGRASQRVHEFVVLVAQIDWTKGPFRVVHQRPPLLRKRIFHDPLIGPRSTRHEGLLLSTWEIQWPRLLENIYNILLLSLLLLIIIINYHYYHYHHYYYLLLNYHYYLLLLLLFEGSRASSWRHFPSKNWCDKQVSSWRHISCHTDIIISIIIMYYYYVLLFIYLFIYLLLLLFLSLYIYICYIIQ